MTKKPRFTASDITNPIHAQQIAKAKAEAAKGRELRLPMQDHIGGVTEKVKVRFHIPGLPKGEPRKRSRAIFSKAAGKHIGSIYPSDRADDWKSTVAIFAKPHCPKVPLSGPVGVEIVFYFPRPKSHFGTGKNEGVLKPSAPYWHTAKPDRDNCEKLVLDQLTKLGFWDDDAQVCAGEVVKLYQHDGGHPVGALVTIAEI